jgi:hypothetical protein
MQIAFRTHLDVFGILNVHARSCHVLNSNIESHHDHIIFKTKPTIGTPKFMLTVKWGGGE